MHNEQLLILAVNKSNYSAKSRVYDNTKGFRQGKSIIWKPQRPCQRRLLFWSAFSLGSQAYLFDIKQRKDTLVPYPGNLIKDPGFEDISSPAYLLHVIAWNGGDRGATFFLDSREHIEGNHSVRLVTPKDNRSIRLRFFPVSVTNGRTYIISVWSKADREQRPAEDMGKNIPQYFEISAGEFGTKRFIPGSEWQEFVSIVTIPYCSELPLKTNVILQMPPAGVAWFDMLQVIEGVDIKQSINPELRGEWNEIR